MKNPLLNSGSIRFSTEQMLGLDFDELLYLLENSVEQEGYLMLDALLGIQ